MIAQDTSKLFIGWNSFSLRILDLILGIIPATFGSIMLMMYLFMGFQNTPMVFIPMIFMFLNLITVVYVSIVLQNAKMQSPCILFLSGGLISFILFILLPYQVGVLLMPWLLPTTLISAKHIFMLTRPKDFYFAMKIPEQYQKFNDLNFIAKEICLNPMKWKFIQILFGAFPAIFLLYELFLWFFEEIAKHQNNMYWFGLTLFIFLFFGFIFLLLIILPVGLKLNQKMQNFVIMFFRATFPFMLLESFSARTGSHTLLLVGAYLSIGIIMYLYHYRSLALIATSEVKP